MNNVRVSAQSRPMTPAEKYYTFLHESWPTNVWFVAELDRVFAPEYVEERWRAFSAGRILTRLMPTPHLTIVDGGTSRVDFQSREVPEAEIDDEIVREALTSHGTEKVVHCRYWSLPEQGTSRVCLIAHHAILDGRAGLSELQAFIRFLAGEDVEAQELISVPCPPARDPYPWQADRKELINLLRVLGDRNRELGRPGPADWPESSLDRRPRFTTLVQDGDTLAEVEAAAAAYGARPFPALGASGLLAVAGAVAGVDDGTFHLNVSVDLDGGRTLTDRPTAMNVGVVTLRHVVRADRPWDLAAEITESLRVALKRGEGELLFHLARVAAVQDLDQGRDLVAAAINAAPPAVSVTHIGTIPSDADPEWMTGIIANQTPTPNQVMQAVAMEYRGRLIHSVATDDLRMPAEVAQRLADEYGRTFDAMRG